MEDLAGKSIGGYPLEKPLRQDAYGVVFQATTSADPIAIKILREDLRADRQLCAYVASAWEVARAVVHQNLLACYGTGVDDHFGAFCLQENLRAKSLRQIILDGMALSWKDALEIIQEVALGLKALHDQGLTHGDLWPGNIHLTLDLDVKLEGAGGLAHPPRALGSILQGAALGYAAPERVQGAPGSPGADLYSLGLCLYNILARKDPFPAQDPQRLVATILSQDPEPLESLCTNLPAEFAGFWRRLCAKDPTARYGRVEDCLADLQALKSGQPLAPLRGGPPAQIPSVAPRAAAAGPAPQTQPELEAEESGLFSATRTVRETPRLGGRAPHSGPQAANDPAHAVEPATGEGPRVQGLRGGRTRQHYFGQLQTQVGSTIPRSDQEREGDNLFRKGQLRDALAAWQAAQKKGQDHVGLQAKLELGNFALKREIFDGAMSEAQACLDLGNFDTARDHLRTAGEGADGDPERTALVQKLALQLENREAEARQRKKKQFILVLCVLTAMALLALSILLSSKKSDGTAPPVQEVPPSAAGGGPGEK